MSTPAGEAGVDPGQPDLAIGVDLGGTNVRVALYRGLRAARQQVLARGAPAAPEPVAHRRELVGDVREPEAIAERLARSVVEILAEADVGDCVVPVGIGIAAMLRGHRGDVANAPNLGWRDVAFVPLVRDHLARVQGERSARGQGPGARTGMVHLYNDVNAITYGEYALGAAVGAEDVLGVFVGTGIGGGVVAGGRLVEGASNCAGEIGHFKVAYGDDAPLCGCGMRGCVEAFVGGVHLQARVRRELSGGAESAAVRIAGGDPAVIHPGHIDLAAAEGDGYALELYAELAPLLAVTLGNAINLLNPGRLVLGGGMLSRTPVLREHVVTALQLTATPALLEPVTVVEPALDGDAGLIGSALLASEGCA